MYFGDSKCHLDESRQLSFFKPVYAIGSPLSLHCAAGASPGGVAQGTEVAEGIGEEAGAQGSRTFSRKRGASVENFPGKGSKVCAVLSFEQYSVYFA